MPFCCFTPHVNSLFAIQYVLSKELLEISRCLKKALLKTPTNTFFNLNCEIFPLSALMCKWYYDDPLFVTRDAAWHARGSGGVTRPAAPAHRPRPRPPGELQAELRRHDQTPPGVSS